jgi:hypothetical protein
MNMCARGIDFAWIYDFLLDFRIALTFGIFYISLYSCKINIFNKWGNSFANRQNLETIQEKQEISLHLAHLQQLVKIW